MSRIEEALFKAAQRRHQKTSHKHDASLEAAATGPVKRDSFPAGAPDLRVKIEDSTLVSALDPASFIAEEYRKCKELLIKKTFGAGKFRNTVMVTSSLQGEGKTTTCLNLAISLAREYDFTVLLMDTDLRKPSCAERLGLGKLPGLSECLLGQADVGDLLVRTGIGKLVLLPAGTPPPNPAELLASHKMRGLIQEMKSRYADRYILMDTPPLLPFSETRTLARIVDGVLLVIREGCSSLDNLADATELLKDKEIFGIIYNDAHMDAGSPLSYWDNYGYASYHNGATQKRQLTRPAE